MPKWTEVVPMMGDPHYSTLNVPFSKEEIKKVAFSSKTMKSSGPDGVPPAFFQRNWSVVGDEIIGYRIPIRILIFFKIGYPIS